MIFINPLKVHDKNSFIRVSFSILFMKILLKNILGYKLSEKLEHGGDVYIKGIGGFHNGSRHLKYPNPQPWTITLKKLKEGWL